MANVYNLLATSGTHDPALNAVSGINQQDFATVFNSVDGGSGYPGGFYLGGDSSHTWTDYMYFKAAAAVPSSEVLIQVRFTATFAKVATPAGIQGRDFYLQRTTDGVNWTTMASQIGATCGPTAGNQTAILLQWNGIDPNVGQIANSWWRVRVDYVSATAYTTLFYMSGFMQTKDAVNGDAVNFTPIILGDLTAPTEIHNAPAVIF